MLSYPLFWNIFTKNNDGDEEVSSYVHERKIVQIDHHTNFFPHATYRVFNQELTSHYVNTELIELSTRKPSNNYDLR